ncbi:ferrous iron transport protein A [Candidatus Calescamantes bacterium]|nr:ferrous iron transport protein A [bacterium]MCK5223471.1 ferrous iron transport protein A [Candidatus Calescamantes bacterium]MCK5599505.1 ferrous iron transport protein A [bacterium]
MKLLSDTLSGHRFLVQQIDGGCNSVRRISEIGIRCGSTLTVISNSGRGQIVVKIGNIKIGLGQGMAKKVLGDDLGKED